jgi:phage N-6-adenine-methyltransferase
MSDSVLARLDLARTALAEAKTIQETKKILDVATAAEILAKRQEMGEEAVRYATSIKVEALAQLGRMLKEMPKNTGGWKQKNATCGTEIEPQDLPPTLADMGLDKKTSKLAQDIAKLPEEKLTQVKDGVIAISKALENVHVSNNSGENEWYTPPQYIEAARKVMGSIDCDPASSDKAQETVKATTYFTKETNGLQQTWNGNVWMNPPYAQPLMSEFAKAVTNKYFDEEITQACVLVNNATETGWFQEMLEVASSVCFVKGRIKFIDMEGNPGGAPLQGQAILYMGNKAHEFCDVFSQFGTVLWKNGE